MLGLFLGKRVSPGTSSGNTQLPRVDLRYSQLSHQTQGRMAPPYPRELSWGCVADSDHELGAACVPSGQKVQLHCRTLQSPVLPLTGGVATLLMVAPQSSWLLLTDEVPGTPHNPFIVATSSRMQNADMFVCSQACDLIS